MGRFGMMSERPHKCGSKRLGIVFGSGEILTYSRSLVGDLVLRG